MIHYYFYSCCYYKFKLTYEISKLFFSSNFLYSNYYLVSKTNSFIISSYSSLLGTYSNSGLFIFLFVFYILLCFSPYY